jgi:hypothetical protein
MRTNKNPGKNKPKMSKKEINIRKRQAVQNAIDSGYITKEEVKGQRNKIEKAKKEKKKKLKNKPPVIYYGLNTNAM